MTTRSALLRAFSWMLLGSMLVMTAFSFFDFRREMQLEIADNLRFRASVVKEQLDTFLFTQVDNMRVWRKLQVMQDIRVDDVDKRISGALAELRAGQTGTYTELICTNKSGRIVAASEPTSIGKSMPPIRDWQQMPGPKLQDVFWAQMNRHKQESIVVRTAIPDAFGPSEIGSLYVFLNWGAIEALLDEAVAGSPRSLLLLDARGQVIGASQALRQRLDLAALRLQRWIGEGPGSASSVRNGAALGYGSLLVGAAATRGASRIRGLGWHTLMIESASVAFRPVWNLLWGMLALLLVTMALAVWIASQLARRIAQPIVDLTEFTRRYRQGDEALPDKPTTSISEVTELFRAYTEMIRALASSRQDVIRASKLAVVGEMAAIMAHEIRTPMSIVRSSAQLLQRQSDLGEKGRELIEFILSETERLNRLVTMLLECARPKPPDIRPHDMHSIVDAALDVIASRVAQAEVHVERDMETQPMVFACDRDQMMQVILNLLLNALEFVPRRGRLAVSTYLEADALWVGVADDGPGVPVSIRQHIFDPFFSRRQGGIGLGLTIVQQIVQAHGGEIRVTDSAWGGAAFNIRFKLQSARAQPSL
ncbi:MAG TPA: ATP-binding protein [Steroidobacteraceae bacterium]|nr:ATP-binding protein [Steroidobacteraceae bacterium]